MKKQLCALLAAGLALSLTSCGISAFDDPDAGIDGPYGHLPRMELVAADTAGKDSAGQLFGELVAEKISEITQGRLTIDYHPNGDLGGDADLLRQVQCGGIDIVVCQTAPVASFVPEMAVFDLPMVFSQYDGDTIDQVLNDPDSEFFIQLSQAYEEKDLHLLGFLQNGTYRITTANRPLYTLEDYHNLQIRTMENSNHMEFWSAIGANPTPLAFSELYFTLSSGGIDAQENAADSCVGINLQEVQDYLACTNHILYANQIRHQQGELRRPPRRVPAGAGAGGLRGHRRDPPPADSAGRGQQADHGGQRHGADRIRRLLLPGNPGPGFGDRPLRPDQ